MQRIFYLARHGQTDFNLTKKIQDAETPSLTELGKEQALALKQTLDKLNVAFDVIICADTKRTRQTLEIVFPQHQDMKKLKIDPRNQERLHGQIIGYTIKDIAEDLGKTLSGRLSWHLYFEGTSLSEMTGKYPENETIEAVRKRIISLLTELEQHQTVLLIGSSVINHYILEYLFHGTVGVKRPEYPSGTELDFQEHDQIRIVSINEAGGITYKEVRT